MVPACAYHAFFQNPQWPALPLMPFSLAPSTEIIRRRRHAGSPAAASLRRGGRRSCSWLFLPEAY